jgi:hypothetical protein
MRTIAIAALLLAGTTGASAQTLYKSTMPDGKVVYSEKPVPGAKRIDTVEPPPSKTGMTTITPEEKARAQQSHAAAAQQSNALDDARKQLQQAEAARAAGAEPLPGERVGTAGGVSRLTDAYHARQKSLELAVQAARHRVQELERVR